MFTNGLGTVDACSFVTDTTEKPNSTASTSKQVITDVNLHISSIKGL